MSRVRLVLLVLILLAVAGGSVRATFSAFTASTNNTGDQVQTARIFPRDRAVPTWDFTDTSGTAAAVTDQLAFDDTAFVTTTAAAAAFSTTRWYDVELSDFAPKGLTPSSVTAEVDFADNNTNAATACMYFQLRTASTDAPLSTYGSAASPLGCEPSTSPTTVSQLLSSTDVPTTDAADDLKLRLYFNNAGNIAVRIYRVVIKVVVHGKTYTLLPTTSNDAVDGVAAGVVPETLVKADTTAYTNGTNWGNTYSATKSMTFRFPATVPGAAVVSGADFEMVWKLASGTTQLCFMFEVISGGSVIGTHGGTTNATAAGCATSNTNWTTTSIPISEVDTAAEANDVTVKVYVWGAGVKANFDRAALHTNWMLPKSGCTDPGTTTISATRDSWTDQNAPTAVTGGTATTLAIRTQSGSRNRRGFVYFPLPSIGSGCSLTGATLRMYASTAAGPRTLDVYRAGATWSEGALNWNNQPAVAGTAVGASSGTTAAWIQWNVLTHVNAMYSGSNYGFVVRDSAEDAASAVAQALVAREGAGNTGQLVLTVG